MTRSFATTLFAATLLLLSSSACNMLGGIDKECIKGRISREQAAQISSMEWEHLPTYNRNAEGTCKDCPKIGDRVLNAKCAEDIKNLHL